MTALNKGNKSQHMGSTYSGTKYQMSKGELILFTGQFNAIILSKMALGRIIGNLHAAKLILLKIKDIWVALSLLLYLCCYLCLCKASVSYSQNTAMLRCISFRRKCLWKSYGSEAKKSCTESHSHRTTETVRKLWRSSSPIFLPDQVHLEHVIQVGIQVCF